MPESSNLDDEAVSTPANLRSTINPNILSEFVSPPPPDGTSDADKQQHQYLHHHHHQRRSLVVRMDEILRQQRESAERISAEEQRCHVAKIVAGNVLVPDKLERDRSRMTYLPLRPYRSPSYQTVCAVCARESMQTPPQNGGSSTRCICREHNASIRRDPILEISVAMSTLGGHHDDANNADAGNDDTAALASSRGNMHRMHPPLGPSLDTDVESCKDEQINLLQRESTRDDTNRNKRSSPSMRPQSPMFEVDSMTEFGADASVVHQPRAPRLVPRLANGTGVKPTSAPLFPPLMTPEHSRSTIDLPSDGPLDVPFLAYSP